MSKKIHLVAGGAGFIGCHLVEDLIKRGNKVICMDNFVTGKEENLKRFINNSNLKIIDHNIIYPIEIDADYVWHLACPGSPEYHIKNPIEVSMVNYIGTLNMLKIALNSRAKFLFASSSEVYGFSSRYPLSENDWGDVNPNGIRGCYREGKRNAESLCLDYFRKLNLDIKIVRIFNTYGPYMRLDDERVVSNFICSCLKNSDINIFGDGNQTRSFCFIDDLIKIMIKVMDSDFTGPINIGSDKEVTINHLAKTINKEFKNNVNTKYLAQREDEPSRRIPNIGLAKSKYKWEPKIELKDGLKICINYFKEFYLN